MSTHSCEVWHPNLTSPENLRLIVTIVERQVKIEAIKHVKKGKLKRESSRLDLII